MVYIQNKSFARMYWELLGYCNEDFNLLAFMTYIIDIYGTLREVRTFNNKEYRRLSDDFIKNRVSWSTSTIHRYLDELEALGLIDKIVSNGNNNNRKARWISLNVEIDSQIDSELGSEIGSQYGSQIGSKRTIKHTNILTDYHTNNNIDNEMQPSAATTSVLGKESICETNAIISNSARPTSVTDLETCATIHGYGKDDFDYQFFYDYYEASNWTDKGGRPINWRQTLLKWLKSNRDNPKKPKTKKYSSDSTSGSIDDSRFKDI